MSVFALLLLAAFAGHAQGPTQVWDAQRDEWVTLREYAARYGHMGPAALRLYQVPPVEPVISAGLGLVRNTPTPTRPDPYITFNRRAAPMPCCLVLVDRP